MISDNKLFIGVVFYRKSCAYINNFIEQIPGHYKIIVIVNNPLDLVFSERKNVIFIIFYKNQGSAGGFFNILKIVQFVEIDFLYLLDDDLIINSRDIEAMLKHAKISNSREILLSARTDLRLVSLVVKGYAPVRLLNTKFSFYRFNVAHLFFYIELSFRRFFHIPRKINNIFINQGYWGGMLINKFALNEVSLHDPDLFLYKDDVQYTLNAIACGFSVKIIPDVILSSNSVSWNNLNLNILSRIFPEFYGNKLRVFYSIRNTIYMQQSMSSNSMIYNINKCLYLTFIFLFKFKYPFRFRLIHASIRNGIKMSKFKNFVS